ncbi:RNase RNM [Pseudoalteromonas xiamenensis]|uniref:PHP domain-containing protein n=1 Tax=Pseudoalteromonas xiamenensis TaxID=882626 RepID=A0A975DJD9_9GAMM|nr:PHP domain-containing protein [Pseudoalteromonas xiamenensis]QTH72943.1 PHP domain-containing protein [Pseudoalteromonas xiamenensis]
MTKYDLHSHTHYSDGRLTVSELLDRAVERNVDVLAITDHDSVQAISEANRLIDEKQLQLSLVSGVEISTKWHSFEIHVVGLDINIASSALVDLLDSQTQKREARAIEIGNRLAKAGYLDVYSDAKALAEQGQITRAHFAQVLVNRGVAKNLQGVFNKFLTRGNTGYVPSEWCTIADAVSAIKSSGGIAVLAHPGRYKMSNKWLRKLLDEFSNAGGRAIEVALPQQAPCERQFLGQLCQEYGLLGSQGSDFHYPTPWSDLGKNLYLPKDCQGVWQFWEEKGE